MTANALQVLTVGAVDAALSKALLAQGCQVIATDSPATAGGGGHDAVLWAAGDLAALRDLAIREDLIGTSFDAAVVVLTAAQDETAEAALFDHGVEAIVAPGTPQDLMRTLRHAVQRKRLERAARTAYATDLATGLPHQAQLLEHMVQLLALREREPAPMVLLVLQVDGFAQAAERLGVEAGNVLRRKVAVRLRAGLRASDVVAAIGLDSFGVLLGRLESKGDGERVADKLVHALQQPVQVAGQRCPLNARVGLAIYPEHGKDAASLLKRASAQAGSVATVGSSGFAASVHRIGGAAAANDDGAA
jgi:diguanylate cyclase (GGDEF)-like protein